MVDVGDAGLEHLGEGEVAERDERRHAQAPRADRAHRADGREARRAQQRGRGVVALEKQRGGDGFTGAEALVRHHERGVEGDTRGLQRRAIAGEPVAHRGVGHVLPHEGHATVSVREEGGGRVHGRSEVVDDDRVDALSRAVDRHDGEACTEPRERRGLHRHRGDDETRQAMTGQTVQLRALARRVVPGAGEDDAQALGDRELLDDADEGGEERVGDRIDQDADGVGRAPLELPGAAVGDEPERAHRLQHAVAGLRQDARLVVDDARHGLGAHPRGGGDVDEASARAGRGDLADRAGGHRLVVRHRVSDIVVIWR